MLNENRKVIVNIKVGQKRQKYNTCVYKNRRRQNSIIAWLEIIIYNMILLHWVFTNWYSLYQLIDRNFIISIIYSMNQFYQSTKNGKSDWGLLIDISEIAILASK